MVLDRLTPNPDSRKKRKRKGRGIAAGQGRTCGRGQKGAGARSGHKKRSWFEGGQMPLARRLPKRGFHNQFREPRQVVNLRDLARFKAGTVIDSKALAEAGLVPSANRPVKILAAGDLAGTVTLVVDAISAQARQKVEAAGGTVELRPPRSRGPGKGTPAS